MLQLAFENSHKSIERRNYYINNHKSTLDFPENDEYFGKIFPDSLPDFNDIPFENELLKIHSSTILEDMEITELSLKRHSDNINNISLNKKPKSS